MKATKLARVLGALLFTGAAFNVNAGAWSISPDPATIGLPAGSVSQAVTISYTGDGATQDAQIDYDFAEASFSAQPTAANNGSCTVVTVGGNQFLRVLSSTGSNIPSTPTSFCSVTFTSLSANTDTSAAEFSFAAGNAVCGDSIGNPTTCTPSGPIRIDVVSGPPPAPILTFGTLTVGATGAGTISVTAGPGAAGSSTALACTSTNGTAVVTGSPFAGNPTGSSGSGSVAVQCVQPVGAGTPFTVTCTPNQTPDPDQAPAVFNATCPGITPQPEFSAALSINMAGGPGTTLSGSSAISNTGNAPLTITCGAPTAGFTVTSAPAASVAAGGSTSLGVSCVAPAAAGATTTGSITCTTNDADEATVVFALSCSSQVLSVPAMGSFGKGIMIALLAGLGLLGFAMRRRAV
jgi:hypothetical protein